MPTPRICLSMIVKNEAHVIERCLRSVRPFIHAWAICDTGSTDGTQQIIRDFLAELPGELLERPWVDFAHNRNEALDLASRYGDYALLIDADDVLEAELDPVSQPLGADAYRAEYVNGENVFYRELLVRLGVGWRWQGVLHEALYGPPSLRTETLRGVRVREAREGARSRLPPAEKYAADAAILRAALEREPNNARYVFYLAQSLRDAGQPAAARTEYQRRVEMGGWEEEVFYSQLQVALLLQRLQASDEQIIAAFLRAHEIRSTRAESFCYLAAHFRATQRHALALAFARLACDIPRPADVLFVDASVYNWRARDELAIACYWNGERARSAELCRALLEDSRLPADQRDRVARNLHFATS